MVDIASVHTQSKSIKIQQKHHETQKEQQGCTDCSTLGELNF